MMRDAQFDEARLQELRYNLQLTPEQRVELCESLWEELTHGRTKTPPFAVSFATRQEYEQWCRANPELGAP